MHEWKLTIPGPIEIKKLEGYSSQYFDLNAEKEMCFHLDASEKGATTNAHFVRSELRHLPNWLVTETHALSAEVRAVSHLKPDKVTVVQIHGITEDKKDAPPLLRLALNSGDLYAIIKTTPERQPEDKVLLVKGLGTSWVKIDVLVEAAQLKISINGVEKVSHALPYWKFMNYFKAGCYPQAVEGTADVMFRKLTAR